jgi:hypothetical protein
LDMLSPRAGTDHPQRVASLRTPLFHGASSLLVPSSHGKCDADLLDN